jgi:hypothetical protein
MSHSNYEALNNPKGMDMLLTVDFTKPEGNEGRYMVTVVPSYSTSESVKESETKELIWGEALGKLSVGYLTPTEALPLLQEINEPAGYAATPQEAAKVALSKWVRLQQIHSHDGIDIPQ